MRAFCVIHLAGAGSMVVDFLDAISTNLETVFKLQTGPVFGAENLKLRSTHAVGIDHENLSFSNAHLFIGVSNSVAQCVARGRSSRNITYRVCV
jgi:hypothetical protein